LTGWAFIQTLDLPLADFANPVWRDAQTLAGVHANSLSVAPADTLEAILRIAMPLLTFMTALMISTSDERAKTLIIYLAIIGGVIGFIGLSQFLISPTTLIVVQKQFYLDSLTTVFVNRNTAATFLGVTILALTVLAWEMSQKVNVRHAIMRVQDWRSPHGGGAGRTIVYLVLLVACLAALLLTKSRAGIASTLVALLFLVPFLAMNNPRGRGNGRSLAYRNLVWGALAVVGVLVLFLMLSGQVLLRAEIRGSDDGRFCILPGILQALSQHYLAGTGFGTFQWIFPAYRNPDCGIWGVWDRAHNFYLEGALNLGILFPIVLIVDAVVLGISLIKGLRDRKKLRHYPALGVAMLILVALHSAIDFSLQIPGFAAFFAAIFAPTLSISVGRRAEAGAAPILGRPA
jgi:hypothetical protein